MLKILKEIGIRKALRYASWEIFQSFLLFVRIPPVWSFILKALGSKIGTNSTVQDVRIINVYRGSLSNLSIGACCFVGCETLLDLSDKITLEDYVTIAERVVLMTHSSVGFRDHPLFKEFLPIQKPVLIKRGSFIGVGASVLAGVTIGEESIVGAGALVTEDVPPRTVVAGVPARVIRSLDA